MSDLLSEGLNWLNGELLAWCGRSVTYRRALTGTEIPVTAVPGRSQVEVVEADRVTLLTTDRDFLIPAADLVEGGTPFLPQPGDRVIDGSHVFEVLAPAGADCWTYATNDELIRIHTKRIT